MNHAMSGRDRLRLAVLRTQSYWPFSRVYRTIYAVAIAAFGRLCQRFPEITAGYVRGTLADDTWIPGSSDVDLTVVIRSGIAPEDEFSFLTELWGRYERLRARLPMLGEMEVLDDSQLAAWSMSNRRTAQPPKLARITGQDLTWDPGPAQDDRWRVRALKDAVWFYEERLLPALALPATPLGRHDSERIARKILRLAGVDGESSARDPVALMQNMLAALDGAVRAAGLAESPAGQAATVEFEDVRYAIGAAHSFSALPAGEVPLTPALFEFYVRHYDPGSYCRLAGVATVRGADPFATMTPPGCECFEQAAFDQAANVLLFPRGEAMFVTKPLPRARMRGVLRKALYLRMARTGQLDGREDPMALSESLYPEEFEKLSRIAERRGAYEFFRKWSVDALTGLRTIT